MDNLPEKRFDIQIIAHSVLQKQYIQIRGLPASQNGQRRSRRKSPTSFQAFRLEPQITYNQTTKGGDRHNPRYAVSIFPTTASGEVAL
jgi:hypothetical protein